MHSIWFTIALLLTFCASFSIAIFLTNSSTQLATKHVLKKLEGIESHIQALFIRKFSARQLLIWLGWAALCSGAVAYWVFSSFLMSALVASLVWLSPEFIFDHLRANRVALFEENFPATLDKMVGSAKSGLSLIQIFEFIATQDKAPASEDFGLAVQNYKLGKDISVVIEEMKLRLNSSIFGLFATAIMVNKDKGGNLPETLSTMSASFKEIHRLDEKVITASAEGRKGARVISLMPIVIFLFVSAMQPALIDTLLSHIFGWFIVFIAVAFYAAGLFWLRRILQVEI